MKKEAKTPNTNISTTSDIEMIEVNTPNFFNRHVLHILIIFGAGFLFFIFLFQIYFRPIYVVGISMQPTLNIESSGQFDKTHTDLVYYNSRKSYNYLDIVIVDISSYLPEQTDPIIKRIIATSGQSITFKRTKTYGDEFGYQIYFTFEVTNADGSKVEINETYIKTDEMYLSTSYLTKGFTFYSELYTSLSTGTEYTVTLASNEYFAMGDNRNNSMDCRLWGPIKKSDIKGKVCIHVAYGSNMFVAIWQQVFKNQSI